MMAIETRKKTILDRIHPTQRNEVALKKQQRFLHVLFYIQGILYVVLMTATVSFGIGTFLGGSFFTEKWNSGGLMTLFSVTYSIQFPATLYSRMLARHYLELQEGQFPDTDSAQADELNTELKTLVVLKNWPLLTAFMLLFILAFSKALLDLPDPIWEKTGLAFALILLISVVGDYRRWRALTRNIDQFKSILQSS